MAEEQDDLLEHRQTADEMDEERRMAMAREYLHRLEQARGWMSECLSDELAPTVEIEESMRNGVLLARLGNFFAPKIVPDRKIFDKDEERYQSSGLHFRHTDNIVQWRRAMVSVGLPEVFMPETTDVYDKKNMPKAVFCLHALSMYLHRRGLAPAIRDCPSKTEFKDEDVKAVADEFKKQGLQLPEFSKIDGMLADELTVDQAKLHEAIRHINEKLLDVENLSLEELLSALQDPQAQLNNIHPELIEAYSQQLIAAKQAKIANGTLANAAVDMYDLLLTRDEIQHAIDHVNEIEALKRVEASLAQELSSEELLKALRDSSLQLSLHDEMKEVYLEELKKLRQQHGQPLSRKQIEAAIELVNAVYDVNKAVDAGSPDKLLKALNTPCLQVEQLVNPDQKRRYLTRMRTTKQTQEGRPLTAEQIRELLNDCQAPMTEDEQRADMLAQCLEAVLSKNTGKLLSILTKSCGHLKNVNDEFADVYAQRIVMAMAENPSLTLEDIQALIDKTNRDCEQAVKVARAVIKINEKVARPDPDAFQTLEENSQILKAPVHSHLQDAYIKELHSAHVSRSSAAGDTPYHWHEDPSGLLVRLDKNSDDVKLLTDVAEACDADCSIVGYQHIVDIINHCNESFDQHYTQHENDIRKAQTQVRGYLAKKQLEKRKQNRSEENRAAAKIQQFYRKNASKKEYQELITSDSPRLATVRKFVQLLERTEMDYEEELEIETLKSEVAALVRSNRKLDENLNIMDVKIGLLVKNRLGVEDVLKHGEKIKATTDGSNGKPGSEKDRRSSMTPNSLRRQNTVAIRAYQDKVGAYQHLLYHLQTEPHYLSKILLKLATSSVNHFADSVLFPLFNHGTQRRDEYLFLAVLKQTLQTEVDKLKSIEKLTVGELLAPKIANKFIGHVGQNDALKHKIQSLIVKFLDDKAATLNTQPLEIYKYAVGEPESTLTADQAAAHPEVQIVLNQTVEFLSKWGQEFLNIVTTNEEDIPYVIRYLSSNLHQMLDKKFPDASIKEIDRLTNQFIYDTYIYPLIATPVMDANKTMPPNDRKKLTAVARLLHFGALNRGYGQDNESHLSALNPFIGKANVQLTTYVNAVTKVERPEVVYGYNPLSELTAVRKPTVYMLVADLILLHKVLIEMRKDLDEQMNEMISKAGDKPPALSDLTANSKEAEDVAQTQLTLALKCTHSVPVTNANAKDSLFLRTKKQLIDLMLCQSGNSILAILNREPTQEEKLKYVDLICDRKQRAEENRYSYDPSQVSSIDELRELALENLTKLEEHGLVSKSDDYQAIVSQIASDIRQAHQYRDQRHTELARVRETLGALEKKQSYYTEQADYYRQYINGCLQNLAPKQNKRASMIVEDRKASVKGDTVSQNSESWTAQSKDVKVTGDKLVKKNLLVKMDGKKASGKGVSVEFKSLPTPGSFELNAKLPDNKETIAAELRFHDLLQSQYDGQETIKLFERAEFNVDELIYFLNKKFLM